MQPMRTTLANAATTHGEILGAARRDGADFSRHCVARRSFAIANLSSRALPREKSASVAPTVEAGTDPRPLPPVGEGLVGF